MEYSNSSVLENLSKNQKFMNSVNEHYAKELQTKERTLSEKPWAKCFQQATSEDATDAAKTCTNGTRSTKHRSAT